MISLLWLIIIFLLVIPLIPQDKENSNALPIIGITLSYLVAGMLIWILLDTKYTIKNNKFIYCSGPIRGTIKIENIYKIERWNKWYVSSFLKPALSKDGLVIYYEKFDDIYISPKNKEVFIAALREINPEIEIV